MPALLSSWTVVAFSMYALATDASNCTTCFCSPRLHSTNSSPSGSRLCAANSNAWSGFWARIVSMTDSHERKHASRSFCHVVAYTTLPTVKLQSKRRDASIVVVKLTWEKGSSLANRHSRCGQCSIAPNGCACTASVQQPNAMICRFGHGPVVLLASSTTEQKWISSVFAKKRMGRGWASAIEGS